MIVPKVDRVFRGKENFDPVFAGVTGSRDGNGHSFHLDIDNVISRRKIDKEFGNARTLNGDSAEMRAAIPEIDILAPMSAQPRKVFFDTRCVNDQQKFSLADAIHDQIVDDSGGIVEQERVLTLADVQFLDAVGQHRVQPCGSSATANDELAHVRNVEDADIVSYRLMFLDDACVLNRHQPAGERHHLGAAFYVLVVKRRFFLRGFVHRPS